MLYHLMPIVIPFGILAIAMANRIRQGKESQPQLWFLLVSGSLGILAILLPGLVATGQMASAPSPLVWLALTIFCLFGLLVGLVFARMIIRRFWLDE